jgi:hypothetical protein
MEQLIARLADVELRDCAPGRLEPSAPPSRESDPFYRAPPHISGDPSGIPEAANAGRYR